MHLTPLIGVQVAAISKHNKMHKVKSPHLRAFH